jgi:hypothetical protein
MSVKETPDISGDLQRLVGERNALHRTIAAIEKRIDKIESRPTDDLTPSDIAYRVGQVAALKLSIDMLKDAEKDLDARRAKL